MAVAPRQASLQPSRGGSMKRLPVPTPFAAEQAEPAAAGSTITSGDAF